MGMCIHLTKRNCPKSTKKRKYNSFLNSSPVPYPILKVPESSPIFPIPNLTVIKMVYSRKMRRVIIKVLNLRNSLLWYWISLFIALQLSQGRFEINSQRQGILLKIDQRIFGEYWLKSSSLKHIQYGTSFREKELSDFPHWWQLRKLDRNLGSRGWSSTQYAWERHSQATEAKGNWLNYFKIKGWWQNSWSKDQQYAPVGKEIRDEHFQVI